MTNIYKKVLYLSSFYKRGDLALRIGLFYTAASLSGAFGGTCIGFIGSSTNANNLGLLARGLAEIGPRGGIEGWRWILIIEGLLVRWRWWLLKKKSARLTVNRHLSVECWVSSPSQIACNQHHFWLRRKNNLERKGWCLIVPDHWKGKLFWPAGWESLANTNRSLASEAESFKWSEVRRGVLDLQVWLSASAYFAILSGLYSFGLFVWLFYSGPVWNPLTVSSCQPLSKTSVSLKMPMRFSCGLWYLMRSQPYLQVSPLCLPSIDLIKCSLIL